MKFVSFNINGIRARIHQIESIIIHHNPDVIGLQETKVHDNMFPLQEIKKLGYYIFFYGQKRHYGVALLTRILPIKIQRGFPHNNQKEDEQCRLIIAEIPIPSGNITIINIYSPQGENRNHPIKFPMKKKFFHDLLSYLENYLTIDNRILIMGDMNISSTDLDIGIGESNRKRWLHAGKCSFLPEEREWMNSLLNWGLVDIWRATNPNRSDCFSWFDYRSKGFEKNCGLRIDMLLATHSVAKCCIRTGIDYNIRGMKKPSDHAPIWAEFNL